MTWTPDPYRIDEQSKIYLNDFEIKKVKQLQEKMTRAPFERDRKNLEVAILQIYRDAMQRYKEENSMKLWGWLNEEEKENIEKITEKIPACQTFSCSVKCEAEVYRIYLESLCRQTDFHFKEMTEKYIGMIEQCKTIREAEILSTIIKDLFTMARK